MIFGFHLNRAGCGRTGTLAAILGARRGFPSMEYDHEAIVEMLVEFRKRRHRTIVESEVFF